MKLERTEDVVLYVPAFYHMISINSGELRFDQVTNEPEFIPEYYDQSEFIVNELIRGVTTYVLLTIDQREQLSLIFTHQGVKINLVGGIG